MIFDQMWKDALLILGIVVVGLLMIVEGVKAYSKRVYESWLRNPSTPLDVDGFVDKDKNPPKYVKIVAMQSMSVGSTRKANSDPIKLASLESPHMPGLRMTQRAEPRQDGKKSKKLNPKATPLEIDPSKHAPIVVGTIRMGFGHHRIAYAACSWAMAAEEDNSLSTDKERSTYFHDLLGIDSPESDLIQSTDTLYSKFSRLASNLGGPIEKAWGQAMLQGDADTLRISGLTAVHLRPLFLDLPRDTPIISTHCYIGLTAVACGFTNVINLVVDNYAQWFNLVPGCLNLVQGPTNYQNFLKMGVSPEQVQLAGHWIPRDLVLNIPDDCKRRLHRANNKKPCRLLIPIGGAGAQRKFIMPFVEALAPLVREGKVQLFLNAGDHSHMKKAFEETLAECKFEEGKDYDHVSDTEGVLQFRDRLLDNDAEPPKPITLFAFEEYFPAVGTTDIMSRVSDVLACKPSELAFYPIPKLMIRRVGDHEAQAALRASEIGDGTLEARTIESAMIYVRTFVDKPESLVQMNDCILANNKIGVYDGCKNAITLALKRANQLKNEEKADEIMNTIG